MPPIRHSTYIGAEPAVVWRALTTGTGWDGWFTTEAEIDARVGGRYRFTWVGFGADLVTETLTGPITEVVDEEVFAFDWESGEGVTSVRFELEARADGTVVTVTEAGYSWSRPDVVACISCAVGWGEALTLLKLYLEHDVEYGAVPPPDPEAA